MDAAMAVRTLVDASGPAAQRAAGEATKEGRERFQ